MVRALDMFKSAFVPTGAIGLHSADYQLLPQALNKPRYGNTYSFVLSLQKIGRPGGLEQTRDTCVAHPLRRGTAAPRCLAGYAGRLVRRRAHRRRHVDLGRVSALRVISRQSTMAFRNSTG
jgi:hypothetical protein